MSDDALRKRVRELEKVDAAQQVEITRLLDRIKDMSERIDALETQVARWHYPMMILIIALTAGGLTAFGVSKKEAAELSKNIGALQKSVDPIQKNTSP